MAQHHGVPEQTCSPHYSQERKPGWEGEGQTSFKDTYPAAYFTQEDVSPNSSGSYELIDGLLH